MKMFDVGRRNCWAFFNQVRWTNCRRQSRWRCL